MKGSMYVLLFGIHITLTSYVFHQRTLTDTEHLHLSANIGKCQVYHSLVILSCPTRYLLIQ